MIDPSKTHPPAREEVLLADEHERQVFIDEYHHENPGLSFSAIETALDEAARRIAPSERRSELVSAMNAVIGESFED